MSRYICAVMFVFGVALGQAQTSPGSMSSMPMQGMQTDESMPPNLIRMGFIACSMDLKTTPEEGEAVLQVEIDPTGHVSGAKQVGGPSRLQKQAIGAVKQWQFKPFEQDGKPVAKTLKVTGPFCTDMTTDPVDQKVAGEFMPLYMSCVSASSQSSDSVQQAHVCGQAAEQAEKFDPKTRFVERRASYTAYAGALLRNKQYSDALLWAEKAVDVVKQGHDDNSGSSSVYATRASAESWLGDSTDADTDLDKAEEFERAALASPVGETHKADYTRALKNLLNSHAQVLNGINRSGDASVKVQEAEKL